jgi:predicted Zn-dependent peptidase
MKYVVVWSMFLIGGVTSALAAPPPVETVTLANGITVVLAPDPDAKAADVAMWFPTGPRIEPAGRSGITHLFERLMFRGTEGAPPGEYRRQIQAEGGVVNTLTTPDYTSIYATVPESAVDLALTLDAERMTKLRITQQDLDIERAFVLRERRVFLETNPVGRGVERLYATAFPKHGYGRPVIGLEDDLDRITVNDALEYYRDRYAPNNAVVSVVGRFDPRATLATIRARFEPLPRRGTAPARPAPPPPPAARGWERLPGHTPLLVMGWRGPASADPASPSLEMLARVLGSGTQGRLSRDLSANPIFAQVRAGYDPRADASLVFAVALVRSRADSVIAEHNLAAAVERLATEPMSTEELDRAKRDWELEWLTEQQTVRGRARALGNALLVDHDPASAARRLDAIRNLTAADVQAVARKFLKPEARSVVWMVPALSAAPGADGKGAR